MASQDMRAYKYNLELDLQLIREYFSQYFFPSLINISVALKCREVHQEGFSHKKDHTAWIYLKGRSIFS